MSLTKTCKRWEVGTCGQSSLALTNREFRVCFLPYSAPYIPRIPRIIPRYSAPRLIPRLVILGSQNTRNGARNARNAKFRDLIGIHIVSFFATAHTDLSARARAQKHAQRAFKDACRVQVPMHMQIHAHTHTHTHIYIYI